MNFTFKGFDKNNKCITIAFYGTSKIDPTSEKIFDPEVMDKLKKFVIETDHEDIIRTASFVKTILKNYDEDSLGIHVIPDASLSYENGKLSFYSKSLKKDNKDFHIKYDTKNKENTFKMTVNGSDGVTNIDIAKEYYNVIEDTLLELASLHDVKEITIPEKMEVIIKAYKLFYGVSPDFKDNFINKKIQAMICLLKKYGVNISDFEFDEIYEGSDIVTSSKLRDEVSKLFNLGEVTEEILSNKEYFNKKDKNIITVVGKEVTESLKNIDNEWDLEEALKNINAYGNAEEEWDWSYEEKLESITNVNPFVKIKDKLEK